MPEEPVDRSRHWAVKKKEHSLIKTGKNYTALIPVLNTFKFTTFLHLDSNSQHFYNENTEVT